MRILFTNVITCVNKIVKSSAQLFSRMYTFVNNTNVTRFIFHIKMRVSLIHCNFNHFLQFTNLLFPHIIV
jgi:hypothetical protein